MLIVKAANCIHDIMKIAYRIGWAKKLPKTNSSGKAVVIGNGPSFAKTMAEYPNGFYDHDVFCVNSFPRTSAFTVFKPRFCVFADPGYWLLSASQELRDDREAVFRAINEKAEWKIQLLFPAAALQAHKSKPPTFSNPNIEISYYNSTLISSALPERIRHYIYRKNLAIAGLQTVVCGCLSLAITMKYKKIFLVGTDASFLEDVTIDDARNLLVTRDCHYYDNGHLIPKPIFADVEQKKPLRAHQYLSYISLMLEGFYECSLFAQGYGVTVINSSAHSWIDSFERGPID